MKKVFLILVLAMNVMTMMAEEFKIGKLTFKTFSNTEVELSKVHKSIKNICIPPTVTYKGITYNVTSIATCAFENTKLYNNPSNWDNGALYVDDCLIRVTSDFSGHYAIRENTRIIGDQAFVGCSALTSVTIPESVTHIGWLAFGDCQSLTSIIIPNGVKRMCNHTFDGCTALASVTLPQSVTSIGSSTFSGCSSLTSITIPNSVTSIEDYAFSGCKNLTSITIPESVTSIGEFAFSSCEALTKVNYNGTQASWDQVVKNSDWMVGSSIEHIHCRDAMIAMEEEVFVIVETMPEFPGGLQAMMKFIAENVQYPANAMEKGGRVVCQFVVEKDGHIGDIQVVRTSGDASLDKEAVRVIGTMPKWKPGIQFGKPVRVTFTLPINFKLSDEPKESAKP